MTHKLKKHIEHSKNAASANKAKGNKHVEILSSLYNNPARFIEEILQNTEDAYNKLIDFSVEPEVVFKLTTESLIVKHNAKVFDEDDLIAITTIGLSTKTQFNDVNMIGKFGLGFKSVYTVCENPQIHSDKFHFEIQDFEVLHQIDVVKDENFNTLIILPLKKDKNIYSFIYKALCEIDFSKLLFCNLLSKICIITSDKTFHVSKKKTYEYDQQNAVYSFLNSLTEETKYFLISKCSTSGLSKFSAAFCIQDYLDFDNFKFIKNEVNYLFVFFQTLENLNLNFYLHGDFTTTPTREHVPFCSIKTPENLKLLDELSVWFYNLILNFKKHKILNSDFWAIMPVFSNNKVSNQSPVNKSITQALLKAILNKKVLPARNSDLHFAKDLIIDKTHKLSNLLSPKDVDLLFDRKEILDYSLAQNIPDFIFKDSSFKQIKVVDIHDFAFAIANHSGYFKRKSFEQHQEFLKLVSSEHSLWSELKKDSYFSLREKDFILCNDNQVYAPYCDAKPQIYRYSASRKNILMVHRHFADDEQIQEFFKLLGLPDPNTNKDFFDKILPVLEDVNVSNRKLYNTWLALFANFQKSNTNEKLEIIENVKNLKCLPVLSSKKGISQKAICSNSYLLNDKVSTFLESCNYLIVDNALINLMLKNDISNIEIQDFFSQFGVNLFPAFIKINADPEINADLEIKKIINDKGLIPVKVEVEDYTIDGLDSFFKNPSLSKSLVLAELLSKGFPTANVEVFTYTQVLKRNYNPQFISLLKENKWIYDNNLMLREAKDDFEVNSAYLENDIDIEKLKNVFGFKFTESKISDTEMKLLAALRELKPDFEIINKLTLQLISEKQTTLNLPLFVELNENPNNLELVSTNNISEKVNVPDLQLMNKIFATSEFCNRLHNLKALETVDAFLKNKEESKEITFEFVKEIFGFKKYENNQLVELILVSGEKTLASEFVFQSLDLNNYVKGIKVRYIAVDNLSGDSQIIYTYIYENSKFSKIKSDIVILRPH